MKHNQAHLSQDDLRKAVVDSSDLPQARQQHLLECDICQQKNLAFKKELRALSQKARDTIKPPLPRVSVIIEGAKAAPRKRPVYFKGLAPALSFTVLLLGLVSVWFLVDWPAGVNSPPKKIDNGVLLAEIEADEKFVAEIESLEEYTMSGFTRQPDSSISAEDNFLDFVTPLPESITNGA